MKRICFVMILICLLLTGCGMEVKDDQAIKEDILAADIVLGGGDPQITWVEILQRQTNKDDKTDRVFVLVEGRSETVPYTCRYELNYEYFDQGGWILQDIQPWQQEEWTIQCPDENQLKLDLRKPFALDLPDATIMRVEWENVVHSEDLLECTAFSTIHCTTAYAECVFPARTFYVLQSTGWRYEETVLDYENAVITPVKGVGSNTVQNDAACCFDFGGSYTVVGSRDDFEWGSQVWQLQSVVPGEYLDIIRDVQIAYYFDPVQLCWKWESGDVLNTEYCWNIAGVWRSTGTANGVYGDYDYDLTMEITDLGGGQFQVNYDFCGAYGIEGQPDGSRIIPDYSGTIYADAFQTEYEDENLWYGSSPENQYVMELDPYDFFGKLYISSENGIYLYRSGAGSRHFDRQ